jgi:hypothetical protein
MITIIITSVRHSSGRFFLFLFRLRKRKRKRKFGGGGRRMRKRKRNGRKSLFPSRKRLPALVGDGREKWPAMIKKIQNFCPVYQIF